VLRKRPRPNLGGTLDPTAEPRMSVQVAADCAGVTGGEYATYMSARTASPDTSETTGMTTTDPARGASNHRRGREKPVKTTISVALALTGITLTACSGAGGTGTGASGGRQEPITVYIAPDSYIYSPSALYRPATAELAGDGTYELTNMTWSVWSATRAVGNGTALIDDCNPDCAGGHFYHVPVVATFSRPVKACKAHYGARTTVRRYFWSQADLTYPSGLPTPVQGAYGLWVFANLVAMAHQSC
jgi:hypothetical protein